MPTEANSEDGSGEEEDQGGDDAVKTDSNETFGAALSLEKGIQKSGNLYSGDRDFFRFTATQKSGVYKITLSGVYGINFRLYDDDLNEVDVEKTWIGNYQISFYGSISNGIYYLEVYSDASDAAGDYTVLFENGE